MRKQIIAKSLLSLMVVACSGDSSYETQAVHDRARILGIEVQEDGLYRFKLCRLHQQYTPQILAEECINPLVTADGQEKVFVAVPQQPNTAIAHLRNWGLAAFVAVTAGVVVYKFGMSVVKIAKTRQLVGEAMHKKMTDNVTRVIDDANISDDDKKFLEGLLTGDYSEGLKQRIIANKVSDEDIKRLMKAEELTRKPLDKNKLAISKEMAKQELKKLKTEIENIKGLIKGDTKGDTEALVREKQRLLVRIDEVGESLKDARFKRFDKLSDKELAERINLWKTRYRDDFENKLKEVKKAIANKSPSSPTVAKADEADSHPNCLSSVLCPSSPTDEARELVTETKVEMKKEQRFYEKFLDQIDAGFRGIAKKFQGFPWISSESISYPKTQVVKHGEVVKNIVDSIEIQKPLGTITVKSGVSKGGGQLTGFSAFIALPLTVINRYLPGHALLSASDDWSSITSGIDSKDSTSVLVEDIATILDGIAQATGSEVSNKARTFAL